MQLRKKAPRKGEDVRGERFPLFAANLLAGSYWSMSIIQGKDQKFGYSGVTLV